MRGYVPQRHRLPLIAASISASVGCGVRDKSALADMIWPAWQYPHGGTSIFSHATWTGWEPSGDRPSMVVTGLPTTLETCVKHERTAWPATMTVQAAHRPIA